MARVPDDRLDKLSALYSPKKTTFATVEYVDVAAIGQEAASPLDRLGQRRLVVPALRHDLVQGQAIFRGLEAFDDLRRRRRDAQDPQRLAQVAQASPQSRATPGADLLAGLLGGRPAAAGAAAPAAPAGIDALVRGVVAPHVVPDFSGAQALLLAGVDAEAAGRMRTILHDPAFQALESAWRGVQWLISNLELDENLELHLLDVTRDELVADLVAAGGKPEQSGLQQALAQRRRGASDEHGWSLLAGLYRFGAEAVDIGLLAALGLVGTAIGAPFVAGADLALAGSDPATLAGWQALRRSQAAPWIGLAAPRLLLRLPYGRTLEPVESFALEEFEAEPMHEHLLWGWGSLAVALLTGRSFMARGWGMQLGDEREIGDLPAYTLLRDGERELQACAEHYLAESDWQRMLDAGLVPLVSHRHRNAVTVVRIQSVAEPQGELAFASA